MAGPEPLEPARHATTLEESRPGKQPRCSPLWHHQSPATRLSSSIRCTARSTVAQSVTARAHASTKGSGTLRPSRAKRAFPSFFGGAVVRRQQYDAITANGRPVINLASTAETFLALPEHTEADPPDLVVTAMPKVPF